MVGYNNRLVILDYNDKLAIMAAMIVPGLYTRYGSRVDDTAIASIAVAQAKRIIKEVETPK